MRMGNDRKTDGKEEWTKEEWTKEESLVSVIVPVYQAKGTLKDCILSVLEQTYTEFELILVDDGSTDGSGEICDLFAKKDTRIHVFHRDNFGAAAARNFGVRKANGVWVAFIDSDDVVSPDYLDYLTDLYKKRKRTVDITIGGYASVSEEESKVWKKKNEKEEEEIFSMNREEALNTLLYQNYYMSVPWGMISRRELWEKVSFPEGTKAEDMGTIYRLFAEAHGAVYGSREVYHYIQRKTNTMFSTSGVRNPDYYRHSREMVRFIRKNHPECIQAAKSRHFSTCFQILSETPLRPENRHFLHLIYKDIKRLRRGVAKDTKARKINRCAAGLAKVGIVPLHMLLRIYYGIRCMRV